MAGKGGPTPGAGRPKGSVGMITTELRTKIEKAGVVEFLIDIYNGKKINGEKPTLNMRVDVAQFLTKKIVPDLKAVEHSMGTGSSYETLVERLAKKEDDKKLKNVN